MVTVEDISEIKRDFEVMLSEEDKEIDSIRCLMLKAERAGAVNTARALKIMIESEEREKEDIRKFIALYAAEERRMIEEQQRISSGCPVVGDFAGVNARVSDAYGVNAVYSGVRDRYSEYSGTRYRY